MKLVFAKNQFTLLLHLVPFSWLWQVFFTSDSIESSSYQATVTLHGAWSSLCSDLDWISLSRKKILAQIACSNPCCFDQSLCNTRNRKHRRAAAKPAACTNFLDLSRPNLVCDSRTMVYAYRHNVIWIGTVYITSSMWGKNAEISQFRPNFHMLGDPPSFIILCLIVQKLHLGVILIW